MTTVKSAELAGKSLSNVDLVWSNIIRMKAMIGNKMRLLITLRQTNFNRIVMHSFLKK